jgi:hypothetical protein
MPFKNQDAPLLQRAQIPLPIQVVIDDVGWWSGHNGSTQLKPYHEPFRTGIARDHVPQDYAAIASLGRQLGIRPQAAFIACEWDKENILGALPSCNWMGAAWDNSRHVGPWQEEAAQILRDNRAHLELTLHGIGHEFWSENADGDWTFTRAEWHDVNGVMRSRETVLCHLELFAQILEQHNLGSFPTSFVPCAFLHRFGKNGDGLAELLVQSGINFISTPFFTMHGGEELEGKRFGFDGGVLTVDRARDLQSWYVIGTPPVGEFDNAICGMHWPNLLHRDPERNEEIVAAWVVFLRKQNHRFDRVLAPDTSFFAGQLLHHDATKCEIENQTLHLDWSQTATLLTGAMTEFILKIAADGPLEFSSNDVEIVSVEAETVANDASSRQAVSILKVRSSVAQKTARIHAVRAAAKPSL